MRKTALALTLVMLLLIFPSTIFAAEGPPEEPAGTGIAITVVVPRHDINQQIQAQPQEVHHIYPVHVWESRENGRREIIRVYELRDNESPAHIPRESFERDGFRFELAEIVRREMPMYSTRDHAEIITVNTQTNDLATVLRLLSPTMEHLSEDGYFGVLALDTSTISIESDGTRTSSHTVITTREFPHLSNADTALVPRTITDGGRTYNLVNVEWRTQSTTPIDYRQVASTFTAVATYTRNATRTSTIGYTTTAEYRGKVSRIAVGRTEFTAHFIGIPIVTPTLGVSQDSGADAPSGDVDGADSTHETATPEPAPSPDPIPATVESVTVEHVHIGGIVIEAERIVATSLPPEATEDEAVVEEDAEDVQEDESSGLPIGNIIIGLLFIGGLIFAYFIGKKGKAMLGIVKKASCILLVFGMMFGISHVAYAAELPRYGFGNQNGDNAVHFDTREPEQSSADTTVHFNPSVSDGANVMHFDPRVTSSGPRASPQGMSHSSGAHNYGDVIGVLTVERLGRNVNVIAGATMEAMDFGAGHFSFTGLNQGNTGLIGHNRGRTNGFFSFVRELREGDILTLEAGGIVRSYVVSMLYIIDAYDFAPLMQFGDNRLSLITCVEYRQNQRRVAVAIEIV